MICVLSTWASYSVIPQHLFFLSIFKIVSISNISSPHCILDCLIFHSERNNRNKNNIKFVIAGKHLAKAFQAATISFNLISAFVQFFIVLPRRSAVFLRRNHGNKSAVHCGLARCFIFVSAIHKQRMFIVRNYIPDLSSPFWSIMIISWRKMKC